MAAFTLHGEGKEGKVVNQTLPPRASINLNLKVVRSWKEALEKANAQYQEAKLASACSLENILGRCRCHNITNLGTINATTRWDGEDLEESGYPGGFLHAPISRRGSRRSSRYSR